MGGGSGGGGGKGSKGSGGRIPTEIQAKVQKVRDMVNKSSAFGDLVGDIKVSRDKDGNYNLTYTQVKNYGELRSATIGVGDISEREEITHTTHVLNSKGKRINTIRKTETKYKKAANKTTSDDWTGGNANRGVSRAAKRRMKSAMQWANQQKRR